MVWVAKRFWTAARVEPVAGGYTVMLDARAVKTPAKAALVVPTNGLAQAIAAEWEAQQGVIDPRGMPFTRSANAAIDKVMPQLDEVVDLIAAYGDSDLICYRATGPERLVARQAAGWDPLLAWVAGIGAPLRAVPGVIHIDQSPQSLLRLRARVAGLGPFELTGFHDLVAMSGSLVIGLAVLAGYDAPEALWALSRIDEDWQAEVWGHDEEAGVVSALKRADFLHAARFCSLCKG